MYGSVQNAFGRMDKVRGRLVMYLTEAILLGASAWRKNHAVSVHRYGLKLLQVTQTFKQDKGQTMKKFISAIVFSAFSVGFAVSAFAAEAAETKATYNAAKDAAAAQYKTDRAKCNSLTGNPKDVCVADAKAAQKRAGAEAEVAYKGSDKARAGARKDIANANYDVAKTKCDALKGNDKDVCVQEAKSAKVGATEDAKADKKIADIRKDAAEDKMDAEYKVAKEKCDALAGAAKDGCMKQIKAKFNK